MAAFKSVSVFLILLVAASMVVDITEAVWVEACNEVCPRIQAERDQCCRAHGHSGYSSCAGGQMECY